jgi:hypothetical protein
MFGVFRVKNHDFTPKNHIFSNFRGGGRAHRVHPPFDNFENLYPQPPPKNKNKTKQNKHDNYYDLTRARRSQIFCFKDSENCLLTSTVYLKHFFLIKEN